MHAPDAPPAPGERAGAAALPAGDSTTDRREPAAAATPSGRTEAWLDAARVLSIVAVVVIHAAAPLTWHFDNAAHWWVGNILNSASRWCVPVFVMVSGALVLDPTRPMPAGTFYRRRLARVGIPLVAWTLLYLAWGELWRSGPLRLEADLQGVFSGRPFYHLWFLYMIAGLYAVGPILRRFAASASRRELRVVVAVLVALGMADTLIQSAFGIGQPNALTLFVPYLGYFLAGYLVRTWERPSPRIAPVLAAVAVASIAITALAAYLVIRIGGWNAGQYLYDYLSPTTVVASFAVFLLLAAAIPRDWRERRPALARVLAPAGMASFGVYLLHPIVLQLLSAVAGLDVTVLEPSFLAVALVVALTTILTFGAVAIIRRLPVLGSLV